MREAHQRQDLEKCKPSQEIYDKITEAANALGDPIYNQNGTLGWIFFLKCSRIVLNHTLLQTKEFLKKNKEERRKLLKQNDPPSKEAYAKLFGESVKMKKGTKTHIQSHLYNQLKVPKSVFLKSCNVYLKDTEKKAVYDSAMKAVREDHEDGEPKELDREVTLDAVSFLEATKVRNFGNAVKLVEKKPPPMVILA